MRCTKCGAQNPDIERFCLTCGHKLQSGRQTGANDTDENGDDATAPSGSRLLDFQGWDKADRGLAPYIEACVYGLVLVAGVGWYLYTSLLWPLYPLLALCALAAWLRRL